MEAIVRYEQGRLPKSMKLWLEQLLDMNSNESNHLLKEQQNHF